MRRRRPAVPAGRLFHFRRTGLFWRGAAPRRLVVSTVVLGAIAFIPACEDDSKYTTGNPLPPDPMGDRRHDGRGRRGRRRRRRGDGRRRGRHGRRRGHGWDGRHRNGRRRRGRNDGHGRRRRHQRQGRRHGPEPPAAAPTAPQAPTAGAAPRPEPPAAAPTAPQAPTAGAAPRPEPPAAAPTAAAGTNGSAGTNGAGWHFGGGRRWPAPSPMTPNCPKFFRLPSD